MAAEFPKGIQKINPDKIKNILNLEPSNFLLYYSWKIAGDHPSGVTGKQQSWNIVSIIKTNLDCNTARHKIRNYASYT